MKIPSSILGQIQSVFSPVQMASISQLDHFSPIFTDRQQIWSEIGFDFSTFDFFHFLSFDLPVSLPASNSQDNQVSYPTSSVNQAESEPTESQNDNKVGNVMPKTIASGRSQCLRRHQHKHHRRHIQHKQQSSRTSLNGAFLVDGTPSVSTGKHSFEPSPSRDLASELYLTAYNHISDDNASQDDGNSASNDQHRS
ncbi:unnamed protein product [Protopolystoma xenopodis]|uniref:Uncharacterized protein n=1 Tax=Protopolystoma xenopodis TaxID=117903 RepID=A0A3S5A7X2_9PLAT|nr:unnamed protein product [Protopolystoma xenopodis]